MAGMLRLACLILALCLPASGMADGRAIIVLDASGSMWDELDGRPKVDIAREALNAVLQALPGDVELGLLAYGHREKGNCDDIELIVPPATGRAAAISTAAEFLNFTGKTPLTAAVRQAAQALDTTNRPGTVILITDGVDNCSGDPCALAAELEQAGTDFTAHVVGFGLNPDEAATVACLATVTGGSYFQADDLQTLTLALQDTVLVSNTNDTSGADPTPAPPPAEPEPVPTPPPPLPQDPPPAPTPPDADPLGALPNFAPVIRSAAGAPPLDLGLLDRVVLYPLPFTENAPPPIEITNDRTIVPPGDYRIDVTLGVVVVRQAIAVPQTGPYTPDIILNAARVSLRPRVGPDATIEDKTIITISDGAGFTAVLQDSFDTWLPAGGLTLSARLDAVTTTLPLQVVAGQDMKQDIFISAAAVVPQVFYAPGQPVNTADLQIEIVAAQTGPDGNRKSVSRNTGANPMFHLGAGDYVAIATLGLATVETPFSIALVQRTTLPIVLGAGVLAVDAAGADSITISPPPDIAGNATVLGRFTGSSTQQTLNAGSYLIVATFGDQTARASVVITPGGRADVVLTAP